MKKVFAILGMAAVMTACGSKQEAQTEEVATDSTAVVADSTATVSETTEVVAPAVEETPAQ